MSAQTLITEHMDLWTGAVTKKSSSGRGSNGKVELTGIKKLRELILELAVRGKLLTQDTRDEPAPSLLARIKDIEQELVKSRRIRKPKQITSVSDEEAEFALPHSWQWVRLGAIGQIVGGGTPKSGESSYWSDKGIPWLTPADLYGLKKKYIATGNRDISELGLAKSSTQLLPVGSVLFSSRAPIGYVAITTGELATNQGFKSCVSHIQEMNQFIYYFLKRSAPHIDASASGTTFKEVSGTKVASIAMPLPPLEEQHRIVQKVDELMALCDRLEQQTSDQLEAHETLVDTLLGTLTQSANATELADNWARLAEHFDTLFTTEQSIDKLKQTILQLAVMGRLVEQAPDDVSASTLLERIAEEKGRLVKEGKIKNPKKLTEVDAEDLGQALNGWRTVRFGELITIKSELVKSLDYPEFDQVAPDSIEKGTGRLLFRRTVRESGAKGPNNRFYKGQILYSKIRPSLSKAVIAEFDGLCSADMYPINSFINSRYLLLIILSEPFLSQVRAAENRIKMPKLNIESLSNIIVSLPPEAEQHRIVEKVDELMSLCDQLKERLSKASETRCQLAEAVVGQGLSEGDRDAGF